MTFRSQRLFQFFSSYLLAPIASVRLLPITLIFAGMLLIFRLIGIGFGDTQKSTFLSSAPAIAAKRDVPDQASLPSAPPGPQNLTSSDPKVSALASSNSLKAKEKEEVPHMPLNKEKTDKEVSESLNLDLMRLSPEELRILETLAARRNELNLKEKELSLKTALLGAAEQRIDQKLKDLKHIQTELTDLLNKQALKDDENLKSLVKIYENMKPKEAARIFSELDATTLLDVIVRMKETKSSLILANMATDKAKILTFDLANRRKILEDNKKNIATN